jgi:hypothetical protein
VFKPAIAPNEHGKKYVFGVFLKYKRIALISKILVVDIVLKDGARGRI